MSFIFLFALPFARIILVRCRLCIVISATAVQVPLAPPELLMCAARFLAC